MIDALRSEGFARVRLGVRAERRDDGELADYVLEEFEPDEVPVSKRLVEVAADAVESVLIEGVEAAMNTYNNISVLEDETAN